MPRRRTPCLIVFPFSAMVGVSVLAAPTGGARAAEPFTLTSSAFADGGIIPKKYAGYHPSRQPPCGGENVSPPLAWSNAPAATKTFAIVMQDPDGGRGTGSNHWVAYDIPRTRGGLQEGEASMSPKEWVGGKNSIGIDHYFGPCGPSGDSPHHYIITLIATSLEPGQLKPGLTREELLQALRGKALAPATIVGKYVRGIER
jgi:Raf kinase inhibitor-like YbhB/YbcL family protein